MQRGTTGHIGRIVIMAKRKGKEIWRRGLGSPIREYNNGRETRRKNQKQSQDRDLNRKRNCLLCVCKGEKSTTLGKHVHK